MKQCIFLVFFVVAAIHGASTSGIIDTVANPPLPSIVMNNIFEQSITKTSHTQPEALSSSVGSSLLALYAMGGIDTLCYIPPVLTQARTYARTIAADDYLVGLLTVAKQLKNENKPEFERAVAWARFDSAYRILQKKLIEADIPGFTLLETPYETITHNTSVIFDEAGKIYFDAALLSIGFSMQEQFNSDPITFYLTFKPWVPTELRAQSGSFLWSWLWSERKRS